MKSVEDIEDTAATSMLLHELDRMLLESRLLRDLISLDQRLRGIERITGASYQARELRAEIRRLEYRLEATRKRSPDYSRTPARVPR